MADYKLLKQLSENRSILIVEDDLALNEELTEFFSIFIEDIHSAFNGEEGLNKLLEKDFDAVITDVNMPEKNGLEMIQEFKSNNSNSNTSFIVLSGHCDEIKNELENLQLKYYLQKPQAPDTLCELLISIFEN